MARRLIAKPSLQEMNQWRQTRIYRESDWNEYIVVFYIDGVKQENADYHTDDKADAFQTAETWMNASKI